MALLNNKNDIIDWLQYHNITLYELVHDSDYGYVVNVNTNVNLSQRNLEFIEVKFNFIRGNLDCSCNQLKSLEGCPQEVRHINLSSNHLTSLQYCPELIHGLFYADDNEIKDLQYFPKYVADGIYMDDNPLLEDLQNIHEFQNLYQEHLNQVIKKRKEDLDKKVPLISEAVKILKKI